MKIDDELLKEIMINSRMGYSPERICLLLYLTRKEREILIPMFREEDNPVHEAWITGQAKGTYDHDKGLEEK